MRLATGCFLWHKRCIGKALEPQGGNSPCPHSVTPARANRNWISASISNGKSRRASTAAGYPPFIEAHAAAPEEVILDLDVTDSPLHGEQEGRFFHGYYRHYCYLPLYIFAGPHLLCARQRRANQDAAAGCLQELERIVAGLRQVWAEVRIIVRADRLD